ncbi:hypothetical protein MSG28_001905 [Choristoneura fumiferana]|uniref:Uncharacterized protein n=1 Tax=Choristoneura fumiferana TaxID=7141 RepID=A0ACC0JT08_CHOFU|nr:hypothetical protein MSG28_001905 [Choristoneura fumiferana]
MGNYDTHMALHPDTKLDLAWWLNNISNTNRSLAYHKFDLEIFTDASRTGWGAVCNKIKANGFWKEDEKSYHINFLELLAIFLALKYFVKDKQHIHILLRVDNKTAIAYINRMGGIQFPHLNNLARSIWQWCEKRTIWVYASYIKSCENKEADKESRRINPDTEWELNTTAFQKIVNKFGIPNIDLFASRANAKCPIYISWKPDPDASNIDAFTITWTNHFFYAFPPFSLILKCIQKIKNDKAGQPSPTQSAYTNCRDIIRQAWLKRAIPPASIELPSDVKKLHGKHISSNEALRIIMIEHHSAPLASRADVCNIADHCRLIPSISNEISSYYASGLIPKNYTGSREIGIREIGIAFPTYATPTTYCFSVTSTQRNSERLGALPD